LARKIEAAAERLLTLYAREREGAQVKLRYHADALREGRIEQVTLEARSALVGEFARKRPPLRLDEISLTLDGVLINPHQLLARDEIELLDLGRITINHLVITEASLRDFLMKQKGLAGLQFHFEDGVAAGSMSRGPFRLAGRLRVTTVPQELGLFRFEPLDATASGVPIPNGLARWFLARYAPNRRLVGLPVQLRLGALELRPGRIEFKKPDAHGEVRG